MDPPRGRTREIIDELIESWRAGTATGGGEIAALAAFLSDPARVRNAFKIIEGEPMYDFLLAVVQFVREAPAGNAFVERVKAERGWKEVPLHIVGIASATGALYSALSTACVAGGEVITASLNYVGVPNAIMAAGAIPRFVDIDPDTWCMDAAACARVVSPRTRAIVLTHLNGLADLEPYWDLFKRRGLEIPLIQDASLAIGSARGGMRPGLINIGRGGMTVMSLTVSKVISGLGGGLLIANDLGCLSQAYEIAHQGVDLADGARIASFGTNFKMSALNAAIAHEQFKRRERIFERRRRLRALYEEQLAVPVASGRIVLQAIGDEAIVTHFGVLLPIERERVSRLMMERHRIPIGLWHVHHQQELYRLLLRPKVSRLPQVEAIASRLAFLPFHTMMSEDDVRSVCCALLEVLDEVEQPKRQRRKSKGKKRKQEPRTHG